MTLWWIGDIVLLVVVLPVVIYLLSGVLAAARASCPACTRSRAWRPPGPRTSTRRHCC